MSPVSSAVPPSPRAPETPAPPPARGPPVADRGVARYDTIRAESWSSRGTVKVLRDAEAGPTQLVGSTSVGGSLRADALDARGVLEVRGPVEVQGLLSVRGELRTGSTVHGGDVTVRGTLRSAGAVTADRRAELSGTVHATSVAAEEIRLDGAIVVPEFLRSPRVSLRPTDRSRVGRIEGETIRVHAKVAGPVEALLGRPVEVAIDRIDGRQVELSGVAVGFVHAAEVVLGRHARVSTVEGTIVSAHRTSHVGPESRSRPPPGLTR